VCPSRVDARLGHERTPVGRPADGTKTEAPVFADPCQDCCTVPAEVAHREVPRVTDMIETETAKHAKTVEVTFNLKPIPLTKGRSTGLEVKLEAIAAGINIQPGFVLFVVKDKKHRTLVGDADTVEVHAGLAFAAVADDDNS
jgi:hypothetical protein